jgi:hypothetical protein
VVLVVPAAAVLARLVVAPLWLEPLEQLTLAAVVAAATK